MRIFLPTIKDRFRLVHDLPRPHSKDLPAGTVFRMDSVKLNKVTKLTEVAHCTILISPDRELTMKKYGGTADYGYTFGISIQQLRDIELEIVEGMD